jgi:hypothetical protein
METATYERYFAGLPAEVTEYGAYFDERRVPLANVLAAVAGLRGDVTIVPPDAGSAGLKAGADR